jgi:hypothetical protein
MRATAEGIEFNIDVIDDTLFFDKTIYSSDHIELWFAMDTSLRDGFNLDRKIYTNSEFEETLDEDQFLEFIQMDRGRFGDPIKRNAVRNDFDYTYDFTGMRHLGINLQNDSISIFDLEQYFYFPPPSNTNQFISIISKQKHSFGYSYKLLLKPEALGFSTTHEWKELYFMFDVFDADREKKLSVLSTNPNRKWGIASSFQKFTFDKPISLCTNQNPDEVEKVFYVYDGKKWAGFFPSIAVEALRDPYVPMQYQYQICSKKSDTLQNGTVVYHRYYENSLWQVSELNGRKFQYNMYSPEAIKVESKGKDGCLILLQDCVPKNPWGEGYCGGCLSCEIQAICLLNGKEEILYQNSFVDQLFELEYKDSTYKGVFQSMEWSKPGKEIKMLVLLNPIPNIPNQQDSYLHYYIRKNKSKIVLKNTSE